MNLIIFFATIDVLTFMALGILFSMKLRETRRIKEIEKEIEKFEARRKIYLAILEDDEDALLAIMKNDKELLLDVINELSVKSRDLYLQHSKKELFPILFRLSIIKSPYGGFSYAF